VAKLIPGALILRRVAKLPSDDAWPLDAVLIPRAEISLIIAQYGVTIGISRDLLAIAMTVMIGTALLPAPILEIARRRSSTAAAAG
jgi:Kef-type K+ transport system membrane component KefB